MKSVLVIGLGRFGRHICMDLTQLKHEVMAVDKNEDCVNAVLHFVTSGIIGDSTREEFLRSLGISNYDLCIVAIGDDFQSSLETTCLLKELGAKEVVSRASRDVHAKFLLRNGADHVVYPEKQLADWTAIRYSSDMISDYFELNEDYSFFELKIPDAWVGMSIGKLDIRKKYKINILGFKHGNEFNLETTPDTVFKSGETMLVVGKNQDIQKCFHL